MKWELVEKSESLISNETLRRVSTQKKVDAARAIEAPSSALASYFAEGFWVARFLRSDQRRRSSSSQVLDMVTAALAEPLGADEAPITIAQGAADDDDAGATDAAGAGPAAAAAADPDPTAGWPTYLLQFMHRFLGMREAEAQACAALAGVARELLPLDLPPAVEESEGGNGAGFLPALPQAGDTAAPGEANTSFRTIRLPGPEAAAEVLRRSMLVRVSAFFFLFPEEEKKRERERASIKKSRPREI